MRVRVATDPFDIERSKIVRSWVDGSAPAVERRRPKVRAKFILVRPAAPVDSVAHERQRQSEIREQAKAEALAELLEIRPTMTPENRDELAIASRSTERGTRFLDEAMARFDALEGRR